MSKIQEEQELICEILQGNLALYRVLVDRYSSMVFSTILGIVGNREDAEEVTQDVFMKAYQALKQYKGDSSFSTWLYRIAYNSSITKIRRKKRVIFFDNERVIENNAALNNEEYDYYNDSQYESRRLSLQIALSQLPEEDALIITLFYFEHKSIDELSYICGKSSDNIKVKLHRIRGRLKKMIADEK